VNESTWNYVKPWINEFDIFYSPVQDNPLIKADLTNGTLIGNASLLKIGGYKNVFANGFQNTLTGSVDANGVLTITYVDNSLENNGPMSLTGTIDPKSYAISQEVFSMINAMTSAESPVNTGFSEQYILNFINSMVSDLNAGKYLTIGFLVYGDFSDPIVSNNGLYIPALNSPENYNKSTLQGGHAVSITAMWAVADLLNLYTGNADAIAAIKAANSAFYLEIQNSWGNAEWGNNGRFFTPMTSFLQTTVDPASLGIDPSANVTVNMYTLGYTTTN